MACFAQLPVARDTITVLEGGRVLRMPWAGGINFANVSNLDVNGDGEKDLVLFDRMNESGVGRFRCFLHDGSPGGLQYRSEPLYSYFFPNCSSWAVFRDFNGDGKEDLFCSTTAGIRVYRNVSANGLPAFTLEKALLYTKYTGGSVTNLYASSIGVPGLADVDGDGDIDVLTYSPLGVYIEFHRNMSKENYGTLDSLVFELGDYCWGDISESNCTVDMNPCGFKMKWDSVLYANAAREHHAGSCITCIDNDGDNDVDLLMGDISCNTILYAHNGGTPADALVDDTTRLYPNYPAKANTSTIKISNFPCTYLADADHDGRNDLFATPNAFASENFNSVWLYRDVSSGDTVNFQFVKNNFLQDEMIEVGQNAFPVLFDENADGLPDLLVGTFGYYINGSLAGKLTLYRNVGTAAKPVFSLVSRDYAGIAAQGLNFCVPAVGDVDGDGDADICIGTSSGQVHWLENTGGGGNPCNFSVFHTNPFNFTTPSAAALPQLFDIDKDSRLDLLIGMKNGRIAWYRNLGGTPVPSFTLMNDFVGKVDVKGSVTVFGNEGYAAPFFYDDAAGTHLLCGSVDGRLFLYDVSSATSDFSLVTNVVNGLHEGLQTAPYFTDVDHDGKRDLFIGNASGGISYFSSSSPFVGISDGAPAEAMRIYPVPARDLLYVEAGTPAQWLKVTVLDLAGNALLSATLAGNSGKIGTGSLASGFYLLSVEVDGSGRNFTRVSKFIKD